MTFRPIVVRRFSTPGSCGKVGGDVPRADVRPLADLGIPQVEVRHLRALANVSILELHEGSSLGPRGEHRSRAKVTERPHQRSLTDLRVDEDDVGPYLCTPTDDRSTAQHGEGMNDCIGSMTTSGSIQVVNGSTTVTPASRCPATI